MRPDGGAFVLTPGGVLVPQRTLFTSVAASPWNAIVTGAGVLKQININQGASLNGQMKVFDALNTLGTPLLTFNPGANDPGLQSISKLFNLPFTSGLSISYSQANTLLSVVTVAVDDTPRHLFSVTGTASPWAAIATGKGVLKGFGVQGGPIASLTQVFDALTATGAAIFSHEEAANGVGWVDCDLPFSTGLTISNNGSATAIVAVYTLG